MWLLKNERVPADQRAFLESHTATVLRVYVDQVDFETWWVVQV